VIGGAILPILGAVLQIWMPSYQRHHKKVVLLVTLYWSLIAIIGPSEALIMILTIPILIAISIVMTLTFVVTWKTGRLKEIRSELMIVAAILLMVCQILRVPLMTTSLFYIPDIMLGASMVLIALGVANPWYHRENKKKQVESPQVAPMTI